MANITDVAHEAGVSLATVSRVISGQTSVRPETRDRVLKAIQKLNYQPNALARQLRTQETKTAIVIVPNIQNALTHEVVFGIESAAESHGYQVLVADMRSQPSIESHYLNAIQQRQVDGIISMSASMTQKLIQQVADQYPLVMAVQDFESCNIPCVSIDNAAASRTAMLHLIRMGHRNIAHITASTSLLLYRERYNSYCQTLEEHGLPVTPELIRHGEASFEGGYAQAEALLASGKAFTAIFAAGDTMAIGAIKALKKHGVRVPQDCAVVGFDDIELAAFWDPALTTIRQPKTQIGQVAFRKLLTLMKKEPLLSMHDILPHELIIRESCGYVLE
nr:LacI family DNA-binding transcriptional regulator [uncultured Agathobaculum sp.]